jgi:hypothetical protein
MHIRIYGIPADDPLGRLTPTQMLVLVISKIPTPVAPMRFTSQLTLAFLLTGCSLSQQSIFI